MEFTLNEPWLETADPYWLDPFWGKYEINQIITEANVMDKVTSVAKRIWDVLKKAFVWIMKKIDNAVLWWGEHIKKKRTIANADVILDDLGVEKRTDAAPDVVYMKFDMVSADAQEYEQVKNIKLESHPIRAQQDPNDPTKMIVKVSDLAVFRNNVTHATTVPHHQNVYDTTTAATFCLVLLCHPKGGKVREILEQFIRHFTDESWIIKNKDFFRAAEVILMGDTGKYYPGENSKMSFTYDQMKDFQVWIHAMNELLMESDIYRTQDGLTFSSPVLEIQNKAASLITRLQFGVNWLVGAIGGHEVASAEYYETIDTFTAMCEFVKRMIDAGVASKYIMYNIVVTASPKLKGDADVKHPRCGQSRLTLFPADQNVVLKFALNPEGQRGNNMEWKLSDVAGMDQYVSRVRQISDNWCGVVMDRCDTSKRPSEEAVEKLKAGMLHVCQKANLNVDPTGDVFEHNCGYIGNRLVTYDYGSTSYTK